MKANPLSWRKLVLYSIPIQIAIISGLIWVITDQDTSDPAVAMSSTGIAKIDYEGSLDSDLAAPLPSEVVDPEVTDTPEAPSPKPIQSELKSTPDIDTESAQPEVEPSIQPSSPVDSAPITVAKPAIQSTVEAARINKSGSPVPPRAALPTSTRPLKMGTYVSGSSVSALEDFEALVGEQQEYFLYYRNWSGGFDSWLPTQMINRGTTPYLTWEPFDRKLSDIANGTHDNYIRTYASNVKKLPGDILLRPMHEMNGNWYPWGAVDGNTPELFIKAYKRIIDIFRSEGADNVQFVWSPNHNGLPDWTASSIPSYYPGDNYVDMVAIDGYNFGTSQNWSTWMSFDQIFKSAYNTVTGFTNKPIMIGEMGSSELGGNKADWITDAYARAEASYPNLVGIVWFHTNKETDWRVNSSASSIEAFQAATAKLAN